MTHQSMLYALLLLIASFIFPVQNSYAAQIIHEDKMKHATVSIIIGVVAYDFYHKKAGLTENQAKLAAFASALAVGTAKELSDSEFSWKDMAANSIGAGLGINIMF